MALCFVSPAEVQAEGKKKGKKTSRGDLVITAVGDIAFPTESFKGRINRLGPKMFAPTRSLLRRGDLVFGNLEAPLTTAPTTVKKTYAYTMPPERLDWILGAGFNLLSLANNHTGDAGQEGVRDMLTLLEEKKKKQKRLYWSGAALEPKDLYKPEIFKIKGVKVAFLAVGTSTSKYVNRVHRKRVIRALEKVKSKADLVVLSVHYGKEYQHVPKTGTVGLYHSFIDAGADLIIGHHPHVLRGIEKYKKGLILHSLGNYTFASRTVRHRATGAKLYGMVAQIHVSKKKIKKLIVHPLYVNNLEKWTMGKETIPAANFIPQRLKGKFARQALEDLQDWSKQIPGNKVKIKIQKNQGVVKF